MNERALNYDKLDEGINDQVKQDIKVQIEIREPLLKRIFDFLLSTIGLTVSAPLWLLIATAIKLEDRGPIFYTQERWGKNKKRIKVYKFRTMVPDADKKWGRVQAKENDPRITRVGTLLRATALDEMPQLLNIWKGEMSFVGPRALPIDEIQLNEKQGDLPDEAIPGFDLRLKVRPGLTGIAQIYAPRDVSRRNKFAYDVLYVKKKSFWLDIRLILLSFWITFRGRWESRENKTALRLEFNRDLQEGSMAVAKRKLIGQILLEARVITETQLNEALKYQKTTRDKIGRCLVSKGYISELQLNHFLNQQRIEAY